jgi:hypothetical protein
MGTVRVEVAHSFFSRPWRVFIGHGQYQIDECGNRLAIPGL